MCEVKNNEKTSLGMHFSVDLDMQSCMQVSSQTCILACSCACMQANVQANGKVENIFFCKNGYTCRQINILSIVKNNTLPMNYAFIGKVLFQFFEMPLSADAVRGIIARLKKNKHIYSRTSRLGNLRGNLYTCTNKVCELIPIFDMQLNMYPEAKKCMQSNESIKDRIDINTLSTLKYMANAKEKLLKLSDEDISFFWPCLYEIGFCQSQISQIIKRLEQINILPDKLLQGLNHAEWELEYNQMKDKKGEHIKKPLHWVFQVLARQGYYPRPANYISPEEQAELDEIAESKKLINLRKEKEERIYNEWLIKQSKEEREKIIQKGKEENKHSLPESYLLKSYYNKIAEKRE